MAEPHGAIVLPRTVFKWYHVRRAGVEVAVALDTEARQILTEAAMGGVWDPSYGLNFALLHVSTAQAFLIAGSGGATRSCGSAPTSRNSPPMARSSAPS